MELYTRITLPKALFSFTYEEKTVLMGSCFAENIGGKMEESKFPVDVNPFGTLYNPSSVANGLRILLGTKQFSSGDLFQQDGIFHSFSHHSRFSAPSENECLEKINNRLSLSSENIRKANRLVITLGTAFVYRLKSDGRIVSNCHKLPDKMFERRRLSVQEITEDWRELLHSLWEQNPSLRLLFTVSPIRHWKDGAHENQISKATLLLAIEELRQEFPDRIAYFPAYEIMMDELRDYRFYADDMLHPSPLAIEYIWRRFTENFLSKETQTLLTDWEDIQKAIHHKPFQPDSEAYQRFLLQTLLKMERISQKIHSFDISKEMELVKSKLK